MAFKSLVAAARAKDATMLSGVDINAILGVRKKIINLQPALTYTPHTSHYFHTISYRRLTTK